MKEDYNDKNINMVEIAVVELAAITTQRQYIKFKPIQNTIQRGSFSPPGWKAEND